jgi:hypothetical protein
MGHGIEAGFYFIIMDISIMIILLKAHSFKLSFTLL